MRDTNALLTVGPAPGRYVVTPQGTNVPATGFQVDPRDPWWARALTSGDIIELDAPDPTPKPTAIDQSKAAAPNASGTGRSEEKK